MKKILFISHSAGRTGAPLMLLHLLQWLKEHGDLSLEILLRCPGPLQEDFAAVAPTSVFNEQRGPAGLLGRVFRKLGCKSSQARHCRRLLHRYRTAGINLVYSNTITNGDILESLASLGCPVITHVHELEGWIQEIGPENLAQVKKCTSHFISASHACKRNLVERHGLDSEKIDVVHSFISIPRELPGPGKAAEIRKTLDIPPDAFVVLGSGLETWRKGKDLFVQLAARVCKKLNGQQVHFLWVGGWQDPQHKRNIHYDLRLLGLTDRVHFTGEVRNPLDHFAVGDVFSLVSREDTFPLVCLEAAALGKPILCFADAGGMPEFVESDAGFVVPFLEIDSIAKKVVELAEDEDLRRRMGESAARKVRERHGITTTAPRILEIMQRHLVDKRT